MFGNAFKPTTLGCLKEPHGETADGTLESDGGKTMFQVID